jgi:hypothetical protein
MNALWTFCLLLGWYSGVAFFAWTVVVNIRSGEAGASGIGLSRSDRPIRFWRRVSWSILILIFMALMPIWIYWKQQQ